VIALPPLSIGEFQDKVMSDPNTEFIRFRGAPGARIPGAVVGAVVVADIDDLVVPSAQIVWKNDAFSKIAPAKSAPVILTRFSSALVKLAFRKIAFRKFALPRFAP
jgi:hypothetical protein